MITRTATGLTLTEVNNALDGTGFGGVALTDGDTLKLPTGSQIWNDNLLITKNITLQGAGADLTRATASSSTATIIVGPGDSGGQLIQLTSNDIDHGGGDYRTAHITGIVFNITKANGGSGNIRFQGNSHMHLVGGDVVGGVLIDYCRFITSGTRTTQTSGSLINKHHYLISNYVSGDNFLNVGAASNATGTYFICNTGVIAPTTYSHGSTLTDITVEDTIAGDSYFFSTGGHVTGAFKNNYVDHNPSSRGNEVMNISRPSHADLSSVPNLKGQYDFGQPYVPGGGLATNGIHDAFYIEDNVFHREGGMLDAIDGGGTIVFRYNSLWGAAGTHGVESGNNMGGRAFECYNNHFMSSSAIGQPLLNNSIAAMKWRGGVCVAFNNRFSDQGTTQLSLQTYRINSTAPSGQIGLGDGTNAFDLNWRSAVSNNGQSITVVSQPSDSGGATRPGAVYCSGTITTVTGGDGQVSATIAVTVSAQGSDYPSGSYVGFCLRDVVLGTDGSDLSQGLDYQIPRNFSWGYIVTDTRVDATHRTFVLAAPANGATGKSGFKYGMAAGHGFELRRVKTGFGLPGGGRIGNSWTMNGGNNSNGVATKFQSSGVNVAAPNPTWSDQEAYGVWQWDNTKRATVGGAWSAIPDIPNRAFIPGGVHNWNGVGSSSTKIPSGYPTSANPLRVGANWSAPGFTGETLAADAVGHPIAAYGGVYPIFSSIAVQLGGDLSFGGVQVSTTATATLAITNSSASTVAVSGITYPTGFSGSFSGNILSGATHNVTVTFAPLSAISYGGTVTVATDAGDFTTVASGTGVASPTRVIALSGNLVFGNHDINTTSTLNLSITNNGNSILTVSGITLPTGFTADWTSGTIDAGTSQTVVVTFTPVAGTTYSGNITVASDKTSGTPTVTASGTGITRVIALSGDLGFGTITVGQTATRTLTVTNNGNGTMSVTAVTYPEGFSGDYAGGSIAAGASVAVHVTFSPTLAQAYSGNVSFTSNKTSGTSTFAATGTGSAAATKIIQITPSSLAFGSVLDGTTLTKAVTIKNSGNTTLTVTDLTVPSGYDSDWTSGTIAAGASQVANITFSPLAATTYNGTLSVTSDATGGINSVTITGTGTAATTKIIALSGSMVFGNVAIGQTVTRVLTIANSGTAVLAVSSITLPTGFTGSFSGSINPGASQDVNITFTPLLGQLYSGTITVVSDKTSGTNTTSTSGTGVVPVTMVINLTGDLTFGKIQKNHTAQRTFVIVNSGTGPLTVTNITCPTGFSTNITTATIPAGTSQNVIVTFAPSAAQSYGGTITVVSNKTSGVNTIACSGTGTNKRSVPFFLIVG